MVDNKLYKELTSRLNSTSFASLLSILPDPDIVLKKAGLTIDIYKEVMADDQVSCCVLSRQSAVKKLEWRIERGNASEQLTKFIEDIFKSLNMNRIISEILNTPLYGFHVSEILWESKDGKIVPKDVKGRENDNFHFDPEDRLRFKSKTNSFEGELLPDKKVLLTQHNANDDNPYGDRLLSKCYWKVYFKKNAFKFWMLLTEKFAIPWLFGKVPRGIDKKDKEELRDALVTLVQDGVAVVPEGSDVTILESAGKGVSADLFEKIILLCENGLSKLLLGQTLTTQSDGKGSYALGKVHAEVRADIKDADKQMVEAALNQLIRWICEFNSNEKDYPEFKMFEEEQVNKELAERDKTLTETGLKFTKKYYQRKYNLQEDEFSLASDNISTEDNDPLGRQPQRGANEIPKTKIQQPAFSKQTPKEAKSSQDILDEFTDTITDEELQKHSEQFLKPVFDMIFSASSHEEAIEKLATLYSEMNSSDFEDMLAKRTYIADILGGLDIAEA
ncbi:MAG: DUF935 family protein [Candidatus Abawacabacteria bacterium]|nr:DUF935 family protein [Candidatus Abawacabacteria bacterium]